MKEAEGWQWRVWEAEVCMLEIWCLLMRLCILTSVFIHWHHVVVSDWHYCYWLLVFMWCPSESIQSNARINVHAHSAGAERRCCTHMCTLHADLLPAHRLTHTIHTRCPLPMYMNNIYLFSSSPPSWKIRSVRESLTLPVAVRACDSDTVRGAV